MGFPNKSKVVKALDFLRDAAGCGYGMPIIIAVDGVTYEIGKHFAKTLFKALPCKNKLLVTPSRTTENALNKDRGNGLVSSQLETLAFVEILQQLFNHRHDTVIVTTTWSNRAMMSISNSKSAYADIKDLWESNRSLYVRFGNFQNIVVLNQVVANGPSYSAMYEHTNAVDDAVHCVRTTSEMFEWVEKRLVYRNSLLESNIKGPLKMEGSIRLQ